jgi:hypothetical protein
MSDLIKCVPSQPSISKDSEICASCGQFLLYDNPCPGCLLVNKSSFIKPCEPSDGCDLCEEQTCDARQIE